VIIMGVCSNLAHNNNIKRLPASAAKKREKEADDYEDGTTSMGAAGDRNTNMMGSSARMFM
jgi:hypothetical protein